MGTSRVVNWWEEWQLRILVLASLGIQYLLAIFAAGRRFHVPRWYRFLMWLCYLGSDAVAIYALATLFNRQRKQDYKFAEGSRDLEVLWAPILLMHLGGQVFITAYNLEDNELWTRHIVTAISQITVAIYVFCKSWSPAADRRLLDTSILLFTLGIAKCIEKTLSLMGASFKSLASDSSSAQRTSTKDKEKELEDYVLKAKAFILAPKRSRPHARQVDMSMKKFAVPDKLFTDTAYPYSDRIIILKSFFVLEHHEAYGSLRCGLSNIFTLLYTKTDVINNTKDTSKGSGHCYFSIWVVTVVLSITAISLFHKSHKQSYSMSDVIVSLVLLYGTFSLDLFSFFAVHALFEHFKNADGYRDIIAQHSLICFLSRDERGSRFIEPSNTAKLITCMVLEYVTTGWKKHIIDAQSYLKFNDRRGHWKLKSEGFDELGWSLEKPFDESVLIWHIATDFCFHIANADKSSSKHTLICRQISNYMMHLLFANPEMLMMGSRRNLFRTACDQLKNILAGEGKSLNEFKLGQKIIEKVKDKKADSSFIHDAWVLAQGEAPSR